MDLNKLTTSDKIIAGSGILLFIAYFLPWFKVDFGFGTATASGGDLGFLWATFPMLLGLIAAGTVIATKLFDVKLPDLPIPWGQAYLILGALAAVCVVLKLIIGEDPTDIVDRSYGIFIATSAALGLAGGGFLKFSGNEEPSAPGAPPGNAPF